MTQIRNRDDAISSLNVCWAGMDEISNKTLKVLKNEIAAPLTVIINQMLYTGIFPDALKVSKVIPLYNR